MTNLIRQTKQTYFKKKFTENKHNSRKLWNLIKCLSGNDSLEHELQQLAEESEIITNKGDIAETLNCFFVDQQKNLTSQIGLNNGHDPFNQNFRKFRSKTQWIGTVQPEKFQKNWSTF